MDGCALARRPAQMGGVRRHPRLRQQLRYRRMAPVAAPHERPHSVGRGAGVCVCVCTPRVLVHFPTHPPCPQPTHLPGVGGFSRFLVHLL